MYMYIIIVLIEHVLTDRAVNIIIYGHVHVLCNRKN
jgi:hypothetical protein